MIKCKATEAALNLASVLQRYQRL